MTANLTIRVSEELKSAFIQKAKRNDTTATALFQQWMKEYLEDDQISTNSTDGNNSTNDTSAKSTNDAITALTARLDQIEQDLYGNDKNIPDRAEKAFDNYLGLEDSLNDLWNEHSKQQQEMREMKKGFDGLSCELVKTDVQTVDQDSHQVEQITTFYAKPTEDSMVQIRETTADDGTLERFEVKQNDLAQGLLNEETFTTRDIAREHNVNPKSLNKYSQGTKVGDRWSYRNKTYEVVHVNKKGEKLHKLVQKLD